MLEARFSVSEVLLMCYNTDFGLSEDESSCDEGEEVHASIYIIIFMLPS